MKQYLELLERIRHKGVDKGDRTGTGQREIFGPQMHFDLSEGFPLVTTKKMFLKGIIHELLWFLKGDTNIKYLNDHGVHIWDAWSNEEGDLGPIYGELWRRWPDWEWSVFCEEVDCDNNSIDQIANLIKEIKETPDSCRMIVTAWNPAVIDEQSLPCCHCMVQFNVQPSTVDEVDRSAFETAQRKRLKEGELTTFPSGKLNCKLYQRSADMGLGVPFNIASYALLTMMIAQVCDLLPGEFIHTFGSAHIYHNHFEQVDTQLKREPYPLPTMKINPDVKNIDDFKFEDFELVDYQHYAHIKMPISV